MSLGANDLLPKPDQCRNYDIEAPTSENQTVKIGDFPWTALLEYSKRKHEFIIIAAEI